MHTEIANYKAHIKKGLGNKYFTIFLPQPRKSGRLAEYIRGAGQNLRGARGAMKRTVSLGVQDCITP